MADGVQIEVRLSPRSSRDELIGMRDGVLQAKVTASPVDGKANKALCGLIAKRLRGGALAGQRGTWREVA
jgi:uncharacterized protein YggU (UPF0235/DUF167 family)